MSTPDVAVRRVPSGADLPKLPNPLHLQLRSETGNVIAKVRWIDTREMLFWCVPHVPAGRDLLGRLTVSDGNHVDLNLRVLSGESPVRSGDGHVHVARWIGADEAGRANVFAALREINPAAFAPDYRPPRPPRAQDRAAAIAAKKANAAAVLEGLRQQYADELALRLLERTTFARRLRMQAAGGLLLGCAVAAGLVSLGEGFQSARIAVWNLSPETALKYDLMKGIHQPGVDFARRPMVGANLHGAQLTGAAFRGLDLSGADLSSANLARTDFRGANLAGANLDGTVLAGARFDGANLAGASLQTETTGADFVAATFDSATRWGAEGPAPGAEGPGTNTEDVTLNGSMLGAANAREPAKWPEGPIPPSGTVR